MGCFSARDNAENCKRPWTLTNPSVSIKGVNFASADNLDTGRPSSKALISSANSYLCTHWMSLNLALVSSSNVNSPWRRSGDLEFAMKRNIQATTRIAFDRLPHLSTSRSFSFTCCEVSRVTLKLSQVTSELSQVTLGLPPITMELPPVTLELSQVTSELSQVTLELSQVTSELSQVTSELSQVTLGLPPITMELSQVTLGLPPITLELSQVTLGLPPITLELSQVTLGLPQVTLELYQVTSGSGSQGPSEKGTISTYCNMSGQANHSLGWTNSSAPMPLISKSAGFILPGQKYHLSAGTNFWISVTRLQTNVFHLKGSLRIQCHHWVCPAPTLHLTWQPQGIPCKHQRTGTEQGTK